MEQQQEKQDASNNNDSMEEPPNKGKPAFRADGIRHVEKGSLTEEKLIEAKNMAKSMKKRSQMTDEEIKLERRAANRLSAFQSRQRRKNIIDDLQKTVSTLTRDNANQQRKIRELKKENKTLRAENASLRTHGIANTANTSSVSTQAGVIGNVLTGASAATTSGVSTEVSNLLSELSTINQYIQSLGNDTTGANNKRSAEDLATLAQNIFQGSQVAPPQQLILVQQQLQQQQQQQLMYLLASAGGAGAVAGAAATNSAAPPENAATEQQVTEAPQKKQKTQSV